MSGDGEGGRGGALSPDEEPRAAALLEDRARFPLADATARWEAVEVREPALPMYVRPTLPTSVDPDAWTYLLDVHEYPIPPLLYDDLKERVPQALLRDLHRPVQEFRITPEPAEGSIVPGQTLHEQLAEVRAARKREALPAVEPTVRAVAESQRRRRAMLAEPWEPALPDDAPRRKVEVWATFSDDD